MIEVVTTALTTLAVAALAAVVARGTAEDVFDGASGLPLLGWTTAAWATFVLACLGLRRVPTRAVLPLVLGGTLAVGAAGMAGPPNTSTDSARYAWDGIVAGAGVSPWAHVPAADALDGLREPWLFPDTVASADGPRCEGPRVETTRSVPRGDVLCTTLNRPGVPTIYPPVAQSWFVAVRLPVPTTATWWPMQLGGLLLVASTTWLVVVALRRRGLDPRRAAWWGWCPFVVTEAVTNSHVDALGVTLVLAATVVAVPALTASATGVGLRRGHRAALVGVLVGLAATVKFVPVVAALPLARRQPWHVVGFAGCTVVAAYAVPVALTGWDVVGYLPGYLREQGYDSGGGFALASLVLPGPAALAASVVALVAVAVLQWRHTNPEEPWTAQLVGAGAALLIISSPYPWYALVLVPFIALTGRWEWFVVPVAMTAHLLVPDAVPSTVAVLGSVAVVTGAWLRRRGSRTQPASAEVLT